MILLFHQKLLMLVFQYLCIAACGECALLVLHAGTRLLLVPAALCLCGRQEKSKCWVFSTEAYLQFIELGNGSPKIEHDFRLCFCDAKRTPYGQKYCMWTTDHLPVNNYMSLFDLLFHNPGQ